MRAFGVMAEPMPSSCAAICGGWSGTATNPKRIASRLLMPSASKSVTNSVVSLSSEVERIIELPAVGGKLLGVEHRRLAGFRIVRQRDRFARAPSGLFAAA